MKWGRGGKAHATNVAWRLKMKIIKRIIWWSFQLEIFFSNGKQGSKSDTQSAGIQTSSKSLEGKKSPINIKCLLVDCVTLMVRSWWLVASIFIILFFISLDADEQRGEHSPRD